MTADEFAKWRARSKLTTSKVAEILGYSRATVARWEANKSTIPDAIAYACTAITLDLLPWPCYPRYQGLIKVVGTKVQVAKQSH